MGTGPDRPVCILLVCKASLENRVRACENKLPSRDHMLDLLQYGKCSGESCLPWLGTSIQELKGEQIPWNPGGERFIHLPASIGIHPVVKCQGKADNTRIFTRKGIFEVLGVACNKRRWNLGLLYELAHIYSLAINELEVGVVGTNPSMSSLEFSSFAHFLSKP